MDSTSATNTAVAGELYHFDSAPVPGKPIVSVDWSLYGGAEAWPEDTPRRTSRSDGNSDKAPRESSRIPKGDFLWLMSEEPHRTRRMEIMKAHPEVTDLMGHEPITKWVVLTVVLVQLIATYLLRHTPFFSLRFFLTAYLVGATANQNLFLAIHEITHNLAFKGIRTNKAFAIFANLPIGVPYAMSFKPYHLEHHKQLGEDGVDTDLPTAVEAACLSSVAGKAFFATFQIFFYAIRPNMVKTIKLTEWHLINVLVQLSFDYVLVSLLGARPLQYLILSSFLAGSLHPCAAHFIAEHYVWDSLDQETYSYYGPLNALTYNVGYHNEHHDFPSIPWTRLPKLRALAPEVYDVLPAHPSWPMVIYNFIFDANVGMYSRVKRAPRSPSPASTTGTAAAAK